MKVFWFFIKTQNWQYFIPIYLLLYLHHMILVIAKLNVEGSRA